MTAHLVVWGCLMLGYAATVMVVIPVLLARRRWTSKLPRTAILVWIGALVSGGAAMIGSVVCVVWAASALAVRPGRTVSLDAVAHGIGLTMTACLMTAVAGGFVCTLVFHAVALVVRRRRLRRDMGVTAPVDPGHTRIPTLVVDSPEAGAVSVPGRRPLIMLSSRLAETLTDEEIDSVVEHERGHLLQRHHLLVQVAGLQYRCVPALPCARSLESSIHLLVELAADDHAARRCGGSATARALQAMGRVTGEDGFRLRAHRLERRQRVPQ